MQKRPSQMHCGYLNYLTAFCFPYIFWGPLWKPIGLYDAIDSVYREPGTGLNFYPVLTIWQHHHYKCTMIGFCWALEKHRKENISMHYIELKQFRSRTWGTNTVLTNLLIKTPRHTRSVSQFQKHPIKTIQGHSNTLYIRCFWHGRGRALFPCLEECWLSAGLTPRLSPPCSCTHL